MKRRIPVQATLFPAFTAVKFVTAPGNANGVAETAAAGEEPTTFTATIKVVGVTVVNPATVAVATESSTAMVPLNVAQLNLIASCTEVDGRDCQC